MPLIHKYIAGRKQKNYSSPWIIKTQCCDGTFDTRDINHCEVCKGHGGPKKPFKYTKRAGKGKTIIKTIEVPVLQQAAQAVNDALVQWVPLDKIYTAPSDFQNRKSDYSEKSVNKIITAVNTGQFHWPVFDPILLWLAPDGNYYILSGHSRTAAFGQLAAAGVTYQGRPFTSIPAKIIEIDKETAKTIALESNTLASPETQTERAYYYQTIRNSGKPEKELKDMIYLKEANNANAIYAYSFLDPKGKAWHGLEMVENGDASSKKIYEDIALWLGKARMQWPFLTNSHEREMYDFLFAKGFYDKLNQTQFMAKLQQAIERNSTFGQIDTGKPLNLLAQATKTDVELTYDSQVQELQSELREVQRVRDQKLKEFSSRTSDASKVQEAMQPYEAAVYYTQNQLQKLLSTKDQVLQAAKNQGNLFLSGRRPSRYGIHGTTVVDAFSRPTPDWGCYEWQSWLIALNKQYDQWKAKQIWMEYFNQLSKWSNVYNWCKYDSDFSNTLKKYGITEVGNIFSDTINAAEDLAKGATNLLSKVGKNIIPIAAVTLGVLFFKEEIKAGAKKGLNKAKQYARR